MFFVSTPVFAQMGSIKNAIFLVDGFFDETLYLVRDLKSDDTLMKVRAEMRHRKDNTITALRTLRWIESPGKERYNKIYSIVESYSDAQIISINKLKDSHDARGVERMIREMKTLKLRQLKELKTTLKYETYRGKLPRPVPIIDKSPFDSGGKTGVGGEIWYR